MSLEIFNDLWLSLSPKEKSKALHEKLLGLSPVIIYLDDESEALEIFESKCDELGIECYASSDAIKLEEFIISNKSRILLIVSDFKMPALTGLEFREKILSSAGEIPFYILSGYVDRELALEGVKYKITGFLNKPFHRKDFMDIIQGEGEKRALSIRDDYEMLKSFTDDVVNIVSEIEESCLHLENDPQDIEVISKVFGLVHTIKGSSGFFEPRTLHLFGHSFEEILKEVQAGKRAVTSGLISSWLKACDVIKMLNDELASGSHKTHQLDTLKKVLEVSNSSVEKSSDHLDAESDSENKKTFPKDQKVQDIKVSLNVLNEFTQVSGELTVIRNMVNKVVNSIEKQYPGDKDVQVLSELLDEMHKINSEMQNKISNIKKVPASQIVKPLSRNFRDTSKALGKEVEFVVEGDDLRMDLSIADALSRSLVHLMRNSLDHGLESNEDRENLGKPRKGKLGLKFESHKDSILVTLEDDGKGINTEKIRQKVIEKNLCSEEEAKRMTDEEVHLMIFESGFSTAQAVTEFSGRGVGMSMVKDTIEEQQGNIKIDSRAGQGSRFLLEIPIPKSVMITNSLFIRAGGMIFGVPQEFITKVFDQRTIDKSILNKLGKERFLRFEGQLLPIISLSDELKLAQESGNILVVINSKGIKFAIEVSEVLDTEDAVIKPIPFNAFKNLEVYQGGTFLGDGTVGLILDVPGLARKLNISKVLEREAIVSEDIQATENVVTFNLNLPGKYALPEKDLFRIEVLDQREFTRSGVDLVMPYRESMLTLIDLGQIIYGKNADSGDHVSTIIVKHGKEYLGLMVKEIRDLEPTVMEIIPTLRKKMGVAGNISHADGTITLLSLSEIIEIYQEHERGQETETTFDQAA